MKTIVAVALALVATYALADGKREPPAPDPRDVTVESVLDARLESNPSLVANPSAVANPTASASPSATASPTIDSSHEYSSDFDSLALSLPGKADGTPIFTRCHESNAKWSVPFGAGPGARVEINLPCLEHEQCMERADRYADWGRPDLALAQLEVCGGVEVTPDPVVVCAERDERIEEVCGK